MKTNNNIKSEPIYSKDNNKVIHMTKDNKVTVLSEKTTTNTIEEMVGEFMVWHKNNKYTADSSDIADWLKQALTKAYEQGAREVKEQHTERLAKHIYETQMSFEGVGQKPEWVDNGNSLKQDEARSYARKILTPQE